MKVSSLSIKKQCIFFMLATISSVTAIGLKTITVTVEVNAGRGEPKFFIVGLPAKAVQESQFRVRTALQNCGIKMPAKRFTVNLAPADITKEGPVFDLPIAMGMLEAMDRIQTPKKTMFLGELSLNGEVRGVKGVLPAVIHARKKGFQRVVIPHANKDEVSIISNITIHPIQHLSDLYTAFSDVRTELSALQTQPFSSQELQVYPVDFSHVHGQESAKRALEIAAAGAHNVLMNGSPGSGKSMMAKALVSILPPLTEQEAIEVTTIYSVNGLTQQGLIQTRPFRSPHHTTSQVGLIGGGSKLQPGEISLSHRGVLFLDEFPEFSRQSLEALRQPLEDRVVQISRASGSVTYPAAFSLVAAANPCPCGYKFSHKKNCECNKYEIERYHKKLSGPILDRIDMHVKVQEVEVEKLAKFESKNRETSSTIRKRVVQARKAQKQRYAKTLWVTNSELTSQAVKKYCSMTQDAQATLKKAIGAFDLSARSYFKVIKTAQTIADLSMASIIDTSHIAEALQYRSTAREE